MSMRFKPDGPDHGELVSGINTTPLVDVMLVLLIIFLITIPVVAHTVAVRLPVERAMLRQTQPQNINIAVTRDGAVFWNQSRVRDQARLLAMLRTAAAQQPQPQVQIHGDAEAAYQHVGRVVLACQQAGINTLSFVTEPLAAGDQLMAAMSAAGVKRWP